MGTGPGWRQKALLRALRQHEAVLVAPPEKVTSRSEAVCLRRSARALVRRGLARGVYLRRRDRQGRMVAHLVLVRPDSDISSNAFPAGSPGHIDNGMANLFVSLSADVKALVASDLLGVPVSPRTAARRARELFDAAA